MVADTQGLELAGQLRTPHSRRRQRRHVGSAGQQDSITGPDQGPGRSAADEPTRVDDDIHAVVVQVLQDRHEGTQRAWTLVACAGERTPGRTVTGNWSRPKVFSRSAVARSP